VRSFHDIFPDAKAISLPASSRAKLPAQAEAIEDDPETICSYRVNRKY